MSVRELQRSTGHAPGEQLVESEPDHEVPPSGQALIGSGGGYLGSVSGQRPVFSVEKPPRTTRNVILALGVLATVAGITVVVLAMF